jgi:hypothetical protein
MACDRPALPLDDEGQLSKEIIRIIANESDSEGPLVHFSAIRGAVACFLPEGCDYCKIIRKE